jgi:biotin operon repressor
MMVMHIRVVPVKQLKSDCPPWRPRVGRHGGQNAGEPPKSLPILIWELLKTDARSIEELCWRLNVGRKSIYKGVHTLRRHGEEIRKRGGMYHLHDGPPLLVQETRGGLRLGPRMRKLKQISDTECPEDAATGEGSTERTRAQGTCPTESGA